MPAETKRVIKNKKIKLPDGNTVLFPIIDQITFTDDADRGQETIYKCDNSEIGKREIHVGWVGPKGSTNATEQVPLDVETPDDCIAVERLDKWFLGDATDRGQETEVQFDNKTFDRDGPPYFTTHKRTHVLRVRNEPDDGNWIETEVIDAGIVLDATDRAQETQFTLANPDGEPDAEGNLIIAANPDDAIEDDSGTAVDPPWRTDPFQNIVNLNSARFAVYIRIIATTPVTIGSGGTCAGPGAPQRSDFDLEKYLLSFKGAYMGFDIYRSKGSITSETANWQLIADNNAPAPGLIFNDSYLLGIFSEADTGGHGVRGYRTYSLSAFQFASQASAPMELDHVWSAQPASPNVNAPNGDPILGPIRVYDTTNPDLTNQPFAATTAATAKIYSWAFTAAQQCTLFDPPGVSLIAAPTSLPSNYQTLFGAQRIQIMEYQGSANVAATSSYDFAPLQLTYKGITYIPEGIQVDEGAPDQHFIAGNPVAVGGYTIGILFKPQPPV